MSLRKVLVFAGLAAPFAASAGGGPDVGVCRVAKGGHNDIRHYRVPAGMATTVDIAAVDGDGLVFVRVDAGPDVTVTLFDADGALLAEGKGDALYVESDVGGLTARFDGGATPADVALDVTEVAASPASQPPYCPTVCSPGELFGSGWALDADTSSVVDLPIVAASGRVDVDVAATPDVYVTLFGVDGRIFGEGWGTQAFAVAADESLQLRFDAVGRPADVAATIVKAGQVSTSTTVSP